jgi:hypothetical protein
LLLIDLLLTKFRFVEQIQKTAVRHRRSGQQVQELLELFAKSNLSVKDFCRQHSISRANFHKWKSRYKSKPDGKEKILGLPVRQAGFATLDVVSSLHATVPGLFAEVKGIRIYQPVSASFLKELLA